MPEILKNIKAEDRLKKIRIISENDDVMGGQPEADGMKENDNNAIFDLACSVMHALAEVAKVDQKAIPQILDALGDSRTAGASQRIVNEVNKLAKAAQTAANQANDKANTANTAAATADKKAVAAQNKANQLPTPAVDQLPIGASGTAYKLITLDDLKKKLGVPETQKLYSGTGGAIDGAMTQKAVTDIVIGINQKWSDVTSKRLPGTTYKNTTSKPIFVSVTHGEARAYNKIFVDGILVASGWLEGVSGLYSSLQTIVPPGSSYYVEKTGEANELALWAELR
ncbi:hypothetical protein [Wohlfahrtiimonas chitiniclastica]|uniref:hypothetical protein n=1 Tax=Wohlfahrtiimonas chitiniclastica TaxID=400946 RepID=UPI0007B69A24|nr:hypothetical protein [Wohlfahrtiimonas chitiniclastica]KZX36873.1 hypothetical protein A6V30_07100 [Wohlfahrtiimonas chitiniclastica]